MRCYECGNIGHYARNCKKRNAEAGNGNEREARVRGNANVKDGNAIRCYECGEQGHVRKNCPKTRKCHNCGKPGHIARVCRQREHADDGEREKNLQKVRCYRCGDVGHVKKDCPNGDFEEAVKKHWPRELRMDKYGKVPTGTIWKKRELDGFKELHRLLEVGIDDLVAVHRLSHKIEELSEKKIGTYSFLLRASGTKSEIGITDTREKDQCTFKVGLLRTDLEDAEKRFVDVQRGLFKDILAYNDEWDNFNPVAPPEDADNEVKETYARARREAQATDDRNTRYRIALAWVHAIAEEYKQLRKSEIAKVDEEAALRKSRRAAAAAEATLLREKQSRLREASAEQRDIGNSARATRARVDTTPTRPTRAVATPTPRQIESNLATVHRTD